jgi:hypothetical protein
MDEFQRAVNEQLESNEDDELPVDDIDGLLDEETRLNDPDANSEQARDPEEASEQDTAEASDEPEDEPQDDDQKDALSSR